MYDYLWKRTENDHGDLGDIVRAGGRIGPRNMEIEPAVERELPTEPVAFPTRTESPTGSFGHPLVDLRDSLLGQNTGTEFLDGAEATLAPSKMAMESSSDPGGGGRFILAQKVLSGKQEAEISCSIFSSKPSLSSPGEMLQLSSGSTAGPMDHGDDTQIWSPRSSQEIKRRKSQAKKVVCVPAPVAASSRPSSEAVPSDLWAWRKYGQKPIKGSPYPRGYYRCSSSKGCSARKQVERSRTDPNILVITYTSEHNHPWPTQRNALAGTARSHPSKNGPKCSSDEGVLKSPTAPKEDPMERLVRHEVAEMEKAIEPAAEDDEFHQSHTLLLPEEDQPDDFFEDLTELETGPLSLIFSSEGFMESKPDEESANKALDPFNTFDWAGNS
ncbi:WRKY [Musa troglodytarum]|uniref:WRKY n=1 Tax=Musa troglodytarum TaxID=320322 RepID=A0A9E7HJS3_9LILI|nr:WRKY [Musa troglodytarum]